MAKFRRLFYFLISLFTFHRSLFTKIYAQPQDWTNINAANGRQKCVLNGDVATIQGFECLFFNILQVIVIFAGLAFLVMFINGGFQYLFSSGDPKKAAAASSTLTMAIMGLIGLILSWLILSLIQRFTGFNVTDFVIPYIP